MSINMKKFTRVLAVAGVVIIGALLFYPRSKSAQTFLPRMVLSLNFSAGEIKIFEATPLLAELTLFGPEFSEEKKPKSFFLKEGIQGWMKEVKFEVKSLPDGKKKNWKWRPAVKSPQSGRFEILPGKFVAATWAVSPEDGKSIKPGKYKIRAVWKQGRREIRSTPVVADIIAAGTAPHLNGEIRRIKTRAYYFYLQGDMKKAGSAVEEGLKKLPGQPELLLISGDILLKAGDEKGALEAYRKALHSTGEPNPVIYEKYETLWRKLSKADEKLAALRATVPAGTKKPLPDDVLQTIKEANAKEAAVSAESAQQTQP